jgi:hypothetical protein
LITGQQNFCGQATAEGYESPAAVSKMVRRVTGAFPRAFAKRERGGEAPSA